MAETRSNAMQGTGPRTAHRSALNTRSKPTGKRDKNNPKMLTKKMVMQELLLEMHKKWRTMKFVPDSKLNARQVLPSQRSIDALDSSSNLMAPTTSSSASADAGVGPGTVTGTDGRTESGGVGGGGGTFRSTDTLRRQRHGPSADATRLNHASARGSGPPGPPGLPRRRPTVATVQRAAELIESRAVKYEHVMGRVNHAFRGDPAGARVLRKSQLGWEISAGRGSSPRKKSGGK